MPPNAQNPPQLFYGHFHPGQLVTRLLASPADSRRSSWEKGQLLMLLLTQDRSRKVRSLPSVLQHKLRVAVMTDGDCNHYAYLAFSIFGYGRSSFETKKVLDDFFCSSICPPIRARAAPFKGHSASLTIPSSNDVDCHLLPFFIMSTASLRSPKDETFLSSHDALVLLYLDLCSS